MFHHDNEGRVVAGTALLLIAALLLLAGCASEPTPWQLGPETSPPPGCIDYRARSGQC